MDPKYIQDVAWIGQDYVKGKIRGVILTFHGLGGGLKAGVGTDELEWSNRGGLVVYPYCGPWSWMNRPARRMVDELVEAIYRKFKLSDRVPLISIGGSMGGQAAAEEEAPEGPPACPLGTLTFLMRSALLDAAPPRSSAAKTCRSERHDS